MAKGIFRIKDCTSGAFLETVVSRNGKTALEKFARQLVEPGKREYHKIATGWRLRMPSGAEFITQMEYHTTTPYLTDDEVLTEYRLHVPANMRICKEV